MISPLFHAVRTEDFAVIRVGWEVPLGCNPHDIVQPASNVAVMAAAPAGRLTVIRQQITHEEPVYPVENIDVAEEIVLSNLEKQGLTWDSKDEQAAPLGLTINRAANNIASRTRRGAGNVVLMNPHDVEYLAEYSHSWYSNTANEWLGRWKHVGDLSTMLSVYACDDQPVGRVVVAYVSEHDGPGMVFEENGQQWLYVLDPTSETLGCATDYMVRIDIL
jgi:hypothetical protein